MPVSLCCTVYSALRMEWTDSIPRILSTQFDPKHTSSKHKTDNTLKAHTSLSCEVRYRPRCLHAVIPTTVGTYMRAHYSSTTVAAQEERRDTRVCSLCASNPTSGSVVVSRRAGAAEACALHAGNALVHTSSTMHNNSMRDALCVVGHKGASCIAEHVRRDVGADVERIAS